MSSYTISVTDGQTLTEGNYTAIKTFVTYTLPCYLLYDNKFLYISKCNSTKTEFEFANVVEGIKATVDANRLVTITAL